MSLVKLLLTFAMILIQIFILEVFSRKISAHVPDMGCVSVAVGLLAYIYISVSDPLQNFFVTISKKNKSLTISYTSSGISSSTLTMHAFTIAARGLFLSFYDLEQSLIFVNSSFILVLLFLILQFKNIEVPSSVVIFTSYLTFVLAVLSVACFVTPGMVNTTYILIFMVIMMVIISTIVTLMHLREKRPKKSEEMSNDIHNRIDLQNYLQFIDEIAQDILDSEKIEHQKGKFDTTKQLPNKLEDWDCDKSDCTDESPNQLKDCDCDKSDIDNYTEICECLDHHHKVIEQFYDLLLSDNSKSILFK